MLIIPSHMTDIKNEWDDEVNTECQVPNAENRIAISSG